MERTTVYLTEDLQHRIKRRAARTGSSEAHVIREALSEYLVDELHEHPWPKSIAAYKGPRPDDGVDATGIKSWMRENWIKDLERREG